MTVPDAALLIEAVTGESRFAIAQAINSAAWTHYAKPGHGRPLEVYNERGRLSRYRPGLFGVMIDPHITDPLKERRVFTEYVPYLHLKVDLWEVLDALEYHSEVKGRIVEARDKAVQIPSLDCGASVAPDTGAPSGGSAMRWTPEKVEQAQKIYEDFKALGVRDYAKRTADSFAITTQRLRAVLRRRRKESVGNKKKGFFDI